jgi:hypothetical protein
MAKPDYNDVRNEIISLLDTARNTSARSVNALMTATYWEIGRRIIDHEQSGEARGKYGESLIRSLAEDLEPRFGRGFGWRNLTQMRAFFLAWPASRILQTPSAKQQETSDAALSLVKEFFAAKERHDLDATMALFSEDAVYIFPSVTILVALG